MNINFKEYISWLLGIALTSAILSDIIYGKSELANEYLIGQLIGQVFSMSMSFVFVLCLFWFMFKLFLKDFFECMFYSSKINYVKPISKKRGKKK